MDQAELDARIKTAISKQEYVLALTLLQGALVKLMADNAELRTRVMAHESMIQALNARTRK